MHLWQIVDCVSRAMGSVGLRSVGLSGGFVMTTLGSGAGGFGMSTLEVTQRVRLFGDCE